MTSRNGYPIPSDVIPVDLKYAEIEYAQGMMVANLAAGNDIVAQGIAAVKAGPVEIKFKDTIETKTVPDSVTNFLPDSWYTTDGEEAGRTDMVFEVL
jgi:hypothetical protein